MDPMLLLMWARALGEAIGTIEGLRDLIFGPDPSPEVQAELEAGGEAAMARLNAAIEQRRAQGGEA